MKVHFICRGNTFRSRLAGAYLNSLQIPDWKASSSGIEATDDLNGKICWYTSEILKANNLESFDKDHWDQTTKENISNSDYIIFMDQSCYDFCTNSLEFNNSNKIYEVWNINDIDILSEEELQDKTLVLETTNQIFDNIKTNIDDLVARLNKISKS